MPLSAELLDNVEAALPRAGETPLINAAIWNRVGRDRWGRSSVRQALTELVCQGRAVQIAVGETRPPAAWLFRRAHG